MVERHIRLNETEDVKEFVNEAAKCEFDIDISYNRIIIDAKSILGILSMDLTRELTVRCYGESKRFNESNGKICCSIGENAWAHIPETGMRLFTLQSGEAETAWKNQSSVFRFEILWNLYCEMVIW